MGIKQQQHAEEIRATVLSILSSHIGKGNGIGGKDLARALGLEGKCDRNLRTIISDLREDGHAICGTPRDGYFIAATSDEWETTRKFIVGRAMHGLRWVSRVEKIALPDLLGQLHVPT